MACLLVMMGAVTKAAPTAHHCTRRQWCAVFVRRSDAPQGRRGPAARVESWPPPAPAPAEHSGVGWNPESVRWSSAGERLSPGHGAARGPVAMAGR